MHINIQNNQENSYEKFKKFLNNPITKFSFGIVGGLTGIGVLSLIAKLIYDKINKNNSIKLDVNDEKYIEKNFFLCAWKNNSCWNDAFIQFLMCPEYRNRKFESEKIMKTLNWIKKILGERHDGNPLSRKIKVPTDVRLVPDGCESWIKNWSENKPLFKKSKSVWEGNNSILFSVYNLTQKYNNLNLYQLGAIDGIVEVDKDIIFYKDNNEFNKNKIKNSVSMNFMYEIGKKEHSGINNNILGLLKDYNLYPTFIGIYDDVNYTDPPHLYAYYVIYGKNKIAKYFLCADGIEDSMKILSVNEGLEKLKNYDIFIKYSTGDIVERYYTPELTKDAY